MIDQIITFVDKNGEKIVYKMEETINFKNVEIKEKRITYAKEQIEKMGLLKSVKKFEIPKPEPKEA